MSMADPIYLFMYLSGFFIILSSPFKCEMKYSHVDISVIAHASKHLRLRCIVFLADKEDVNLMENVKIFSENKTYSAVVSSKVLENILADNLSQLNFLQMRTVIVTKEKFNLTSVLNKVSAFHRLIWIIFADYALFPNLHIPVSSRVIFINSTPGVVSAMQVYHIKPGINETMLWTWNSSDSTNAIFFDPHFRKMNFRNVSMDMLILTPRETCQYMHNKALVKKVECIHQDFLELMGRRLNFSINIVECLEKEHPFTYPNGSDSELFLRLKHREVDFSAISHVIITHTKRDYLEFVWPTFGLKSMMYLKQGRLAGRWASYLRPLENSVWWGILIWILITGILIQLFEKLLTDQLKFNFSLILDLITSTLKALQVFCNQAVSDLPKSYSIRIIFFLKFFVVLIFFQAYSGYLVSSLTIVVSYFPFKDLKEFLENQQYQVMTLQKGFHQFYFRKVVGAGQRENFMLPQDQLPDTIQQAIDKLCAQDYLAFSEFREDLLNFDKLNCKISELPSPIAKLFVGIAMPSKTPIREFLRRELLYLKSAGIVQRLASKLSSRSDFRDKKSQDEFITVSMTQIFSIFIVLGMGISLSIFIFILELIIDKSRRLLLSSLYLKRQFKKI